MIFVITSENYYQRPNYHKILIVFLILFVRPINERNI